MAKFDVVGPCESGTRGLSRVRQRVVNECLPLFYSVSNKVTMRLLLIGVSIGLCITNKVENTNVGTHCSYLSLLDLVYIDTVQSIERLIIRLKPNNGVSFRYAKCRTAAFQKSFMSRCTRVWNVLPKQLRVKNLSFVRFKSELYKYYKSALNVYDAENSRTWKSICLSCNKSRSLSCSNSCY